MDKDNPISQFEIFQSRARGKPGPEGEAGKAGGRAKSSCVRMQPRIVQEGLAALRV